MLESNEVLNERVKRGDLTIDGVRFSDQEKRRLLFWYTYVDVLIDEEYMGGEIVNEPLGDDWPRATPGNGQPPTIGQLAYPGRHVHPWGSCYVDHGPGYKYQKQVSTDGTITYYGDQNEWDTAAEHHGIETWGSEFD